LAGGSSAKGKEMKKQRRSGGCGQDQAGGRVPFRLQPACRRPPRAGFPARRGFLMRLVIIIARLIAPDDLVALALGTLVV